MAAQLVIKNDGSREQFDRSKVEGALLRAGASRQVASEIAATVEERLRPNSSTKSIYQLAFRLLSSRRPGAAYRFSLKGALMGMGPEGYPFETYLASLLREYGYGVQARQMLAGRCVVHEVDVVAEKGGDRRIYECKYHNASEGRCHIQNALYTYARYLDLKDTQKLDAAFLATNTKFSHDVIAYSDCVGLGLLGWSHPRHASLQAMIEGKKLYPLNILPAVSRYSFYKLHAAGIITVKEVLAAGEGALEGAGVRGSEIPHIKEQAKVALSGR